MQSRPIDEPTAPFLVTGAGGFLGWNLCLAAVQAHPVAAVYRTHAPPAFPRVQPVQADLVVKGAVEDLLHRCRPRGVIHAAALARPEWCQTHPDASFEVNVAVSLELARCCARQDIPLVFVSTDLVFDGDRAPYAETDPPRPISVYGSHKAEAEERVLSVWPRAVVCRLPLLFGFSRSAPGGVLSWMLPALRSGERLRLFIDEVRTPVDAESAAKGLLAALHWNAGIYHLGGATPISRWAFGHLLARILAVPAPEIETVRISDVSEAAPRPADVSLSSEKARARGWRPPVLESALARMVRRWETER
jgi:dTDP-4-dehydrorhamnose reductase